MYWNACRCIPEDKNFQIWNRFWITQSLIPPFIIAAIVTLVTDIKMCYMLFLLLSIFIFSNLHCFMYFRKINSYMRLLCILNIYVRPILNITFQIIKCNLNISQFCSASTDHCSNTILTLDYYWYIFSHHALVSSVLMSVPGIFLGINAAGA
jgi:hypothetical protein